MEHDDHNGKDNRIWETDIPERFMVFEEITGPPPTDEASLEEESNWLYDRLKTADYGIVIEKEDITTVLVLMHVQKYDVPFIAMYRKDKCLRLFNNLMVPEDENRTPQWNKVLWAIEGLDREWLLLKKRKNVLHTDYQKRFEKVLSAIEELDREWLLLKKGKNVLHTDYQKRFEKVKADRKIAKELLPLKRNIFSSVSNILKTADTEEEVDDIEVKFNLHFPPPELRQTYYRDSLWEHSRTKADCSEYTKVGLMLCSEPTVRKKIRSVFREKAVVRTNPTYRGETTINSAFHRFWGVKNLKDKSIKEFDVGQWSLVEKAQREKLIRVTVDLPANIKDEILKILSDSQEYILRDGVAQLWNEHRELIVEEAFVWLIPLMGLEARTWLSRRAKKWVCNEYGKLLWEKASMAPFKLKEKDVIMACCRDDDNKITFVVLDYFGELVETLFGLETLEGVDHTKLTNFMIKHKPHLVVIEANNLYCLLLKKKISEIVNETVNEENCKIVFGNESLPKLYEESPISSYDLPVYDAVIRRAVALGRFIENPVAMIACLQKNSTAWKVSPYDDLLSPDEKYGVIERILMDITNQSGLDINLCIQHNWLFSPLKFISGLGPIKADFLKTSLLSKGVVSNRTEFLTAHHLSKKVYLNAVGFLRVRRLDLAAGARQDIDFLDDTRIHPRSYKCAQEIAKDIYKKYGHGENDNCDLALEHAGEKPEFRSWDVDSYAKSKGLENKKQLLKDIKLEMLHGFQDCRRKYEEPSQDEEFAMLSGETNDILAEGRIIKVTVQRLKEKRAICVLESGLIGILMSEDYCVGGETELDLTKKVKKGDILSCRIKSIQKNHYMVFLEQVDDEKESGNHDLECPGLGSRAYGIIEPYYSRKKM